MTDVLSDEQIVLAQRLRAARQRVVERCMYDKGGAFMSLPAKPDDLDVLLDEAADALLAAAKREGEMREWLRESADPHCHNCDGSGIFYGNVHICPCLGNAYAEAVEARLAEVEEERHNWQRLAGNSFHSEHAAHGTLLKADAALTALRKELDSCQRTLVKATETSAFLEAERDEARAWQDATEEALAEKLEALTALRKEALEVVRPFACDDRWRPASPTTKDLMALALLRDWIVAQTGQPFSAFVAKHGGGELASSEPVQGPFVADDLPHGGE